MMLAASFTFCPLNILDKNRQCHNFITKLNTVHLIWIEWLLLYLIKKRDTGKMKA